MAQTIRATKATQKTIIMVHPKKPMVFQYIMSITSVAKISHRGRGRTGEKDLVLHTCPDRMPASAPSP